MNSCFLLLTLSSGVGRQQKLPCAGTPLIHALPFFLIPRFGWTALYEAAGTGHRHILDRLVQAGADPTIPATSWPRHTPSQMARQMGWNACVDVLVKAEKMWAERKREDRETDREETKEEEVMGLSEHPALSGTVGGDEKTTAELSSSTGTKPAAPGTRKEKEVAARSLPSSTTRPVSESGGSTEKFDSSTAGPSSPPSSPSSFTFSSSSSSPLSSGAARLAGPTGVASSKTSSNHVEATQTVSPAPPTTPSKKTDLPACLRWQVEEGVGEGGHEGRWGAWEEAEEDWLEVHPAVFSKRGPRVGRRRREGGGAGSWVLGCLRRNKTLMNLATGRTGERIKARAGSRRNPRWVVQKE
jgi:hypothetical protein